jgi:gliding motility-associated-like protein
MKMLLCPLLGGIIALLLNAFPVFSQSLEYTENKGQWNDEVQFMGRLSTGALYLLKDGYKVLQYDAEPYRRVINAASGHSFLHESGEAGLQAVSPEGNMQVKSHAYRVRFTQSENSTVLTGEKKIPGYTNFFIGNDPSKWKSEVGSYHLVNYLSVYKGVDVRFFSDNGFAKYEWIIAPYGELNKIKLEYEGVESLRLDKGELVVKTSVGETRERKPYSYQLTPAGRKEIPCSFIVTGNRVTFRLSGYDPALPLVIDPTFVFSTFVGSVSDNWGYTATFDKQGNAYGGGIIMGSNYPVTTGAFQTNFGGGTSSTEGVSGFDMNIVKLDPQGRTRIYSTFLGGNSNEQPHSLIVDESGNLIVAGRTLSANYPLRGSGLIGSGGQWDIAITKFNAAGTQLIGSVRIGGTLNDGVNVRHKFPVSAPSFTDQNYGDDARSEVVVDAAGNIYLAGCTQSANFPVTPNNVQGTLRGEQDALVLKFNPLLSNLEFATFLGGTNYDAAYVLTLDAGGDIYVAGGTMSLNFPGDKAGTVGASFAGGQLDGFIVRIDVNNGVIKKAAYIGTSGNDQLYGIQHDKNGFVYVMGTSTGNFPVRNAVFRQNGGKQFIAKIQPDLSNYVYSTVFGTNSAVPNLSPTAFLVDNCENVYVSGWGGNIIPSAAYQIAPTTGMTVTPDAIKPNTDGLDFYFFVLEKDATKQLYGSFFGQQTNSQSHDHVDGGTSRFDENGIIYQGMCANCDGGQFPTTPGTVSPNNPSSRCNLAIVKINFNLSGVRAGLQSFVEGVRRDTSTCVPATIEFRDSVALGKRFEWNFNDGSPGVVTDTPFVRHTFTRQGNYRVRLIAIDDGKCITRDTAFLNIRVRIDRVPMNATVDRLPPCTDLNYRFNNLSTPFPGKPFKDSSFLWLFGDNSAPVRAGLNSVNHRFPAPGTYNVRLVLADTNYCNAPDTFHLQVRVNPDVVARISAPQFGCAPFTVTLNNSSLGGSSFFWDFGNGQRSTITNPTVTFTQPGNYQIRLRAIDPSTCNLEDSTVVNLLVVGSPNAAFSFTPNPSRENIPTTFINQTTGDAAYYKWFFGDGDSLITARGDTLVRHQFPRTGVYNTCLVAITEFGCADTTCVQINALVNPMVDVVSAFTPNNDGTNDRAVVIGFGVTKMNFRIYNRLGQLVFESNDVRLGWDGKFKGKDQPMDGYAYTLDAELIDGTPVKKTGSITLIR